MPTQKEKNQRLIEAARDGNLEQLNQLIADGADINARDECGDTALIYAVYNKRAVIVERFLTEPTLKVRAHGARNRNALVLAVCQGYADIAKLLLAHPDIDVNQIGVSHNAALNYAASNGYVEIVNLLLARDDIDVNHPGIEGNTPLTQAIENNHLEVARAILEHPKVDINAINQLNKTAFTTAISYRRFVDELLAHPGLDFTITDNYHQTPLSYAASFNYNLDAVKKILPWSELFNLTLDANQAKQQLDTINQRIETAASDSEARRGIRSTFVAVVNTEMEKPLSALSVASLETLAERIDFIKKSLIIIQPNEEERKMGHEKTAMRKLLEFEVKVTAFIKEAKSAQNPTESAKAILKSFNVNDEALDPHIDCLLYTRMETNSKFQTELLRYLQAKTTNLPQLKLKLMDIALARDGAKIRSRVQEQLKLLFIEGNKSTFNSSPYLFILRTGVGSHDQKKTASFVTLYDALAPKKPWIFPWAKKKDERSEWNVTTEAHDQRGDRLGNSSL